MQYLLDTNICIYLIRQHPPQVVARLSALRQGDVGMSAITYAELWVGVEQEPAERSRNEAALARLTSLIPVLPFGNEAARHYGILRTAVSHRKKQAMDQLIAAHALSLGLVLVTNNLADFKDYPSLSVENWVTQ